MNNKKNSNSNKHIEVIFVMPLGVDESLFIWGIHFLKDALRKTCENINVKIWDCRIDTYFKELNKRYSSTLGKLFLSLKPDQVNTFYRVTDNPYVFFDIASFTGDDFFKIAGLNRWFRRSCARDLRALQSEVKDHIGEKVDEFIKESGDAIRVWAFSVFDNSLFSALHIAHIVKQRDPESSIILGNDAFTFQIAEEVMKSVSFVDGIAFGYGEEIMRVVISELQGGIPVRDIRLKGFVNDYFIRNPEESESLRALNTPPFYNDFLNNPIISCINQPKTGEIRIWSQRGCKWGKCAFCTQFDRGKFYLMSGEHLHQILIKDIKAAKSSIKHSPIFIVFDGYENDLDMFTGFLKYLNSVGDLGVPIDVMVFLQIKSFRKGKEFFHVLNTIDNKPIRILLRLHIESLNFDTLRNMRKGNSPLQSIEAVKAAQDCGHFVGTNYFTHFPLENCDNISRELEILKPVIHLLMPPKGGGSIFPYVSNNRDSIYQNQEKYKIKVRPLKGDTWLKDVFGIDLPFSHWSFYYKEKSSFNLDRLLAWSYYEIVKANAAAFRPRWIAKKNWGHGKLAIRARLAFLYRSLKLLSWKTLHYSLTVIGKGKVYRKRFQFFKYLINVSNVNTTTTTTSETEDSVQNRHKVSGRMVSMKGNGRKSYFFLEDRYLKKEYNGPGKKEKWSVELSSNELKILRYLYWSRKRRQVMETFKEEMSEAEIIDIIARHIKQGSLVQFKDLLLCVFNDPGYWK